MIPVDSWQTAGESEIEVLPESVGKSASGRAFGQDVGHTTQLLLLKVTRVHSRICYFKESSFHASSVEGDLLKVLPEDHLCAAGGSGLSVSRCDERGESFRRELDVYFPDAVARKSRFIPCRRDSDRAIPDVDTHVSENCFPDPALESSSRRE